MCVGQQVQYVYEEEEKNVNGWPNSPIGLVFLNEGTFRRAGRSRARALLLGIVVNEPGIVVQVIAANAIFAPELGQSAPEPSCGPLVSGSGSGFQTGIE